MKTYIDLQKTIQEVRYNPTAIQSKTLELLESATNGQLDIVDPSNPFVFLLEASATQAAATMIQSEALTRKQYPSMALTEDELYLHMSDYDYIGRFATPSQTVFTLLFEREELKRKAVQSDISNIRKLVVPKNTEFKILDYTFTMQYPLEMRVMDYGGIQVSYDNTDPSPLQTLNNNIADWDFVKINDLEFVRIKIPVNQFKINTSYNQISKSTPLNVTYDFNDQFYYARIYSKQSNEKWIEIKTTHTDQVFDPSTPTAILKVYDSQLKVTIPQIYIDSGLIDGGIRTDIYTTKGDLNLLLDSYQVNSFLVQWIDRDLGNTINKYSLPLNVFSSMAVYSDAAVGGGGNGLSFEQLRQRVMSNVLGNNQLPITDNQLKSKLLNKGYKAIKYYDNVTDRVYLTIRQLPAPLSGYLKTAAGSAVQSLQISFNDLYEFPGAIVNNERATIKSGALFNITNGILKPTSFFELSTLNSMNTENFLNAVNTRSYLVTPFHYVLDNTNSIFKSRAYYLDNPIIESKEFVQENVVLGYPLSTESLIIKRTTSGYLIQITINEIGATVDLPNEDILPVMSFKPIGLPSEVFLEGQYVFRDENDKRVYNFFINTNFDINENHQIYISNFKINDFDTDKYAIDLAGKFDLVYYIKNIYQTKTPLNYRPNCYLLDSNTFGSVHEKINFKFGQYLNGFWETQRTILEDVKYLTYEENVIATYTQNVYERDPQTGSLILSTDDTGRLNANIIHAKGDTVLDQEGRSVIRFKKGDTVLDGTGRPIVADTGNILKELDLFLIDGKFSFSTNQQDIEYLKEIPRLIAGWLESDVMEFQKLMLEQTKLYFHPLKTYGSENFLVKESEKRTLNLEQSFRVTFYLDSANFSDTYLRESLKNSAIDIINQSLQSNEIKINEMISKLTNSVKDDVVSLDIEGLGGDENLDTMTILNESANCSIQKKLVLELDNTLKVIDDVEVKFIKHKP